MSQHTYVPFALVKAKLSGAEPVSKPPAVRRRNDTISRSVDEQGRGPNRCEVKARRTHVRKVIVDECSGASSDGRSRPPHRQRTNPRTDILGRAQRRLIATEDRASLAPKRVTDRTGDRGGLLVVGPARSGKTVIAIGAIVEHDWGPSSRRP